jgi:hypothetical protein
MRCISFHFLLSKIGRSRWILGELPHNAVAIYLHHRLRVAGISTEYER